MFVRDALFFNSQKTEPWWFRLIRRLFAIAFVVFVLIFANYQIRYLATFFNTPHIFTVESKRSITYPSFIICPESVSPAHLVNDSTGIVPGEPQFSVTCGEATEMGPGILSDIKDFHMKNESDCKLTEVENGCLKFSAPKLDNLLVFSGFNDKDPREVGLNKTFMYFDIKRKTPAEEDTSTPVKEPTFYTIYFTEHQTTNVDKYYSRNISDFPLKTNYNIEYNMFPIITGQRSILEYSIFIHRVFSNSLMGQLDVRPDMFSLEIKADMKVIPNGQTQFLVLPKIPHYMREEIEKFEYQPISIVSNLGGFYGAIVAFYITMFGMSKVEPWGVFQKVILRCWPCRRSFKRKLAEKYVSAAGIPLGEDIDERPEGASLEDRVQILEYLLKDQYLDTYYLDSLKFTKLHYDKRDGRFNRIEQLIDTRDRTNQRDEEQEDDNSPRSRWKTWSIFFGFSRSSTDNEEKNVITSTDSRYSSGFLSQEVQDTLVEVKIDE